MVGMIIGGILLFIGVVLIPYTDIVVKSEDKKTTIAVIIFNILILSNVFLSFGTIEVTKKETYIKCLKYKNPYEMVVKYELRDSILTPVDTVYTLINKK